MEENKLNLSSLIEELRKDNSEGSYYYAWQANIAMPIYDRIMLSELGKIFNDEQRQLLHKICNEGAKDFLNLLIK